MAYNSIYDLQGQKVSNTYHWLVQSGSNGKFYDGDGNEITINATVPDIYVLTSSFNNFTSSYNTGSFTGSFTGSLLGTASWADNSVLLNYTSSGVFATTGSNIFIGNQTITGSIYMDAPGTDSIYFSQSGPAGRLVWNETDGTLDLGLKGNNVTLQIGQELVQRVVNKTGADLLESQYKVVRIRRVDEGGTQGQRLAVVLAQANNDANSVDTLGIVTENIADNQEGFITTSGLVRNIDTRGTLQGETWADGDVLYLSPTVAGQLTTTKPQAPQHTVIMGYVVYRHQNNGKIFVKVDNGYEIDELHNVRIDTGSLTAGQLLVRSGSNNGGVWINTNQLTGSYGLTGSLQATSFTGSLLGTGSWANNAITASYVLNAVSSSFASTASYADTLDGIDSTQFARLDIDNTFNGINTVTQKTLRDNSSYVIAETSISSDVITGPDTQSIEVFNIYNYVTYTTDRPALNTAATFDYTLFDDTLTSIRSGRVNLSWTPNNAGQEAITDTQTIVNTGESSNIIFNSSVDYGIGSEFVKLNVINGASKPIYIRGFLRII